MIITLYIGYFYPRDDVIARY